MVAPKTAKAVSGPSSTKAAPAVCGPSSTKLPHRLKAEIQVIKDAIKSVIKEHGVITCRQCFYAVLAMGLIKKTETEYRKTICRLLADMRESNEISFDSIADNTRWMYKPTSYDGLADALAQTANLYRRDLWRQAPVGVQIWCEKDALAGVIMEETRPYDVPLFVSRGFGSRTYLHNAGRDIAAQYKPVYIYHFGDYDPSGEMISTNTEAALLRYAKRYSPKAEIHFIRMAVTPEQIKKWNLPTRPTKLGKNPHKKGFKGDSVDLDALPAKTLRKLVRDCIEQHIDKKQLKTLETAEASEQEHLKTWAANLATGKDFKVTFSEASA